MSRLDKTKNQYCNLYPPSYILNIFLPFVMPLAYFLLVFVVLVINLNDNNSFNNLFMDLTLCIVLFIIFLIVSLTVYILKKNHSKYFSVNKNKLTLNFKGKAIKEYSLESIESFLVLSNVSLEASGSLRKFEFFIVDNNKNKERLYYNDIGNNLVKSWKKFAYNLECLTNRKVIFSEYTSGFNGKKHKIAKSS